MLPTNAPKTLLEGLKFADKNNKQSNELKIELFMHLKAIYVTEIWKKDSFYRGAEQYKAYQQKKFGALIGDVYGKSTTWFRNMSHIFEMPNGRELYARYGHANMVAYLAFSPANQAFVLKEAAKRPISNFHYILTVAGLRGKDSKKIDPAVIESNWHKRYNALERKYNALKEVNKKLKIQLRNMKRKQGKLHTILNTPR